MPDENKMKIFSDTRMTIFKSCPICRHGEISGGNWGYCKHPNHFFTHAKHGRVPGVSHVAMGCDDFEMMNQSSREMAELGPYLDLLPLHYEDIEEVGVEEDSRDEEPVEMSFDGGML